MKPSIGIFGLSGCWGEQIVILNCEDQLLDLVGEIEIADFRAAASTADSDGPLAIAFVEGSVGSNRDEAALKRIRDRARLLIACGSCACYGGVAAEGGDMAHAKRLALVYGSHAATFDSRPHRPLSEFVKVDLAIPGCPMEKEEFLQAVACLLNGDAPEKRAFPVCAECRMAEQECLLQRGQPCAGPVTAAGCGARCPGFNVGCIGCRGPVDDASFDAMAAILARMGLQEDEIARWLHMFAPPVAAHREEIPG